MSRLRTVVTVVALGVAVYGVSVYLHRQPSAENETDAWPTTPTVDIGAATATMPPIPPLLASPADPAAQAEATRGQEAGLTPVPDCKEFDGLLSMMETKLAAAEYAEALLVLTPWLGDPRLSERQSAQLDELLDQLAGTVVYSHGFALEPHYVVQPGDTLEQIAAHYGVEWQLLAKINGIADPAALEPGRRLKVVRGPFDAVLDLRHGQLVLVLQGRYAGRFAVDVSPDFPAADGAYRVQGKTASAAGGPQVASSSPEARMPLRWIALNGQIAIHGKDLSGAASPGSIRMEDAQLADLYDILTCDSTVTLRR